MKYRFINYTLDCKSSELDDGHQTVLLPQKAYLLLLCMLKNPQQILSKDFLLTEVWQDRLVSDNTIAKTVAQLRQLLNDDTQNPKYIITHRGRGISFTPEVTLLTDTVKQTAEVKKHPRKAILSTVIVLLFLLVGAFLGQQLLTTKNNNVTYPPNLLVYTNNNKSPSENWLASSTPQLLSELLSTQYNGKISSTFLDSNTDISKYLNQQFQINPELNVIQTTLTQQESGLLLHLDFTHDNQITQSKQFIGETVNEVLSSALVWLKNQLNITVSESVTELPQDPQVLELYMRGMAASTDSDYEKAAQYFKLALTEQQDFHWARLQLAQMHKLLGENDEALMLLDTLQSTDLYPKIVLKAVEIRGYIYDLQGRYLDAKELFEQTLEQFQQLPMYQTNSLRFELSYVLTQLNHLDEALALLKLVEKNTTLKSDPQLYADTLHKIASIQQSLGQVVEAESYANSAINTYLKINQPLGAAKVHSLLARIFTFKNEYKLAKHHLSESLLITKNMDYKLGTGAVINELVYLLLREGSYDQAEPLIEEMQGIALELNYTLMLISTKQHAASLAMGRHDWLSAERNLQQQIELASKSNNQAALLTAQLQQLEFLIHKGSTSGVQEIIDSLSGRIDPEKNIRQHIALELRRAQFLRLNKQQQAAVELLNEIKTLATKTQDNQSLIEVNNTLAEIFLNQQPKLALSIIKENKPLNPLPYPYLLILSKVLLANNQPILSLQTAIQCKNSSGQLWQREDEAYLSQLELSVD